MKDVIKKIMYSSERCVFVSVMSFILWLASLVYSFGVQLRNGCYSVGICKSRKLKSTVICVGNVAIGGTGKTPIVEYILRFLDCKAARAAVLTRGYMPQAKENVVSDEVKMLRNKFPTTPILVGSDRFQLAQHHLEQSPCDVFVMDDGYQHRQLHRDLNIAVVDATNPFGNEFLIPRGILREPLSALSRADSIVLTKVDQVDSVDPLIKKLQSINENAPIIQTQHDPVSLYDPISSQDLNVSLLKNKKVFLMSGIGNPQGFHKTVEAASADVVGVADFSDHFVYSNGDVEDVIKKALAVGAEVIVTTEKDVVKLESYFGLFAKSIDALVLGIELKIVEGEEGFHERLASLL